MVLIMGPEIPAVSKEVLQNVDKALHIDKYGKTESLNVAMALSVAHYEYTNQLH